MIKGRYVAALIIDIHIDREDVDFKTVKDSIEKDFTKQLQEMITDCFWDGDVDVTLTHQQATLCEGDNEYICLSIADNRRVDNIADPH